jgi:type I restriction enzyme S subunit
MEKGELPKGWVDCQVQDVGEVVSGGTPSTKLPDYWGNDQSWISPSDLSNYGSKYISKGAKSLSFLGLKNCSAKVMPAGSIHFSSRAPIGYVVISFVQLCTNQGFKSLVPFPAVYNEYGYYYFLSIKQLAESQATGTTFKELSGSAFARLPFPLPPLNEQRRIVAKIEELFSDLDAGVESLKKAREQLGVYRQSLLKQAFEGKLTAEWRKAHADELDSAPALLERIRKERIQRYQQQLADWKSGKSPVKPKALKPVEPLTPEELAKLPELPEGWAWVRLKGLNVGISDGPFGSNLKTSDYVDSGIRVVRLENIGIGEFVIDKESYISEAKYRTIDQHTVYSGDIVFSSFINDAVRATIIPASIKFAVNKADCFSVKVSGRLLHVSFLEQVFLSRYFYKHLESQIHGVGRPRINTSQLGGAPVPLCSFAEQREIVRILEEQFSAIDQNEREIDAALAKSEALRQSILNKAFSGQLVPQDPSDEPASVLIERIRAERASRQSKHKRQSRKQSPIAS